jgi:putative membrane protein
MVLDKSVQGYFLFTIFIIIKIMKFLLDWIISAAVIFVLAYVLPGVVVEGYIAALGAAIVIGLANATVKPLLIVLTLPITVLTLGLFLLVINALVVLLAVWLVPGFYVDGFLWALAFGLILSIVNSIRGQYERSYRQVGFQARR